MTVSRLIHLYRQFNCSMCCPAMFISSKGEAGLIAIRKLTRETSSASFEAFLNSRTFMDWEHGIHNLILFVHLMCHGITFPDWLLSHVLTERQDIRSQQEVPREQTTVRPERIPQNFPPGCCHKGDRALPLGISSSCQKSPFLIGICGLVTRMVEEPGILALFPFVFCHFKRKQTKQTPRKTSSGCTVGLFVLLEILRLYIVYCLLSLTEIKAKE